ncbi:TKL protein kinase [Thecamonas trahens ATCC 50062]|uniref:TKL protein kinase n=1 Tax=Thecamonas trahens ATCC 50062 TaxID=461836 RepID=A0A0L0D202_THETB|nr:TKL protein kinase [Thecamonas trahens ATCC 50062]KNC46231.1 TKL protein kinase [Thecamonas trahens ATCC 50062]|eukprot:XP_013760528.1 TKL protein kinase [Thecamonas trahens ATCC 50062]
MSSVKGDASLSAADRKARRKRARARRAGKVGPADSAPLVGTSTPSTVSAVSSATSGMFSSEVGATAHGEQMNVGTIFWAAPEVLLRGSIAMTPASDAFSLGITLWELATRGTLYAGENALAVALEIVDGRRPDVAGTPASLVPLVPIMTRLWENSVELRLTLDEAEAELAGTYSNSAVVYPTTAAEPSGEITAVHCTLRNARVRLLRDPVETGRALRTFHTQLPELASDIGVSVLAWGLGWLTLGVHRSTQLTELLGRCQALNLPQDMAVTMLVTCGEVRVVSSTRGGNRELGGPVIDSMRSLWSDLFGLAHSGLEEAEERAYAATLLPSTPKSLAWEHTIAGGLFVAEREIVNELTQLDGVTARPLPWPVSDTTVFHVTVGDELTVVDTLAQRAAKPSPSAAALKASTSRHGEWLVPRSEIVGLVAQGGETWMGSYANAHRARWRDQEVVVKTLLRQDLGPEDVIRMAELSASALMSSSETAVGPLAVCLDKGQYAIIVPFYEGGTLDDVLLGTRRNVVFDAEAVAIVARLLASSLAKLHGSLGIAHGSLRPSNVALVFEGSRIREAHAIDFGMDGIKANMGTMTMIPSVAYMSPEALRGDTTNIRGDVFVMGTILFEMIARESAFSGSNALEVGFRISNGRRPEMTPSQIPSAAIRELIDRCWRADPHSRPSMAEVVEILARLDVTEFVSSKRNQVRSLGRAGGRK